MQRINRHTTIHASFEAAREASRKREAAGHCVVRVGPQSRPRFELLSNEVPTGLYEAVTTITREA